ncbi:IS66 family insertion sequence element accessory protein TnpB [Roseobacter sp. OBYS 0001]|uniref:IS66 family insertion sequence element accessory protein TnpB n=1 Tax=Roseobacter TaxID=2433 RepID=UPI0035B68D72
MYWDGQGFCLIYNVLQRSRCSWPSAKDCSVRLTCPQLSMLWERIIDSVLNGVHRLHMSGGLAPPFALFTW